MNDKEFQTVLQHLLMLNVSLDDRFDCKVHLKHSIQHTHAIRNKKFEELKFECDEGVYLRKE